MTPRKAGVPALTLDAARPGASAAAALVADGQHARVDGFTSLSVLLGVIGVLMGLPIVDPIVGIGISIAANKVPSIRAALAHDVTTARLARAHNDANVLALGGRIVTPETAVEMVQTFLTTAYLGGRHQRRLDKITQIERDVHMS